MCKLCKIGTSRYLSRYFPQHCIFSVLPENCLPCWYSWFSIPDSSLVFRVSSRIPLDVPKSHFYESSPAKFNGITFFLPVFRDVSLFPNYKINVRKEIRVKIPSFYLTKRGWRCGRKFFGLSTKSRHTPWEILGGRGVRGGKVIWTELLFGNANVIYGKSSYRWKKWGKLSALESSFFLRTKHIIRRKKNHIFRC